MGKLLDYNGSDKVKKRIADVLNVTDVQVNGASIVDANGIADVSGAGGSTTLADLTDVDVTGVSNGDTLAYNSTSQKWEDKTLSIPTKTSDLTNDSGFITNTVNNLSNYYKKTETYTQSEVDALISAIVTINIEIVQALPTTDISTTTIYLVPAQTTEPNNFYEEYLNTTGTSAGWELIGTTEIDLSNYYTKSEVDALIPTVNDATLTIKNGPTSKGTFTANASSNANITVLPFDITVNANGGYDVTYPS